MSIMLLKKYLKHCVPTWKDKPGTVGYRDTQPIARSLAKMCKFMPNVRLSSIRAAMCHALMPPRVTLLCLHVVPRHSLMPPRVTLSCRHVSLSHAATCHSLMPPRVTLSCHHASLSPASPPSQPLTNAFTFKSTLALRYMHMHAGRWSVRLWQQ